VVVRGGHGVATGLHQICQISQMMILNKQKPTKQMVGFIYLISLRAFRK
jgi:hypothetical protein